MSSTERLRPIAVSPSEAAQIIGLSRAQIYNLINDGRLRRSKIGTRTLIHVADLEALLEETQR